MWFSRAFNSEIGLQNETLKNRNIDKIILKERVL